LTKSILFFGDSLTAGYGLNDTNEAFPGLIQIKINALELPYKTINAGLSGEITEEGNDRIDAFLKNKIDILVLELGVNDGLRGLSIDDIYNNLQSIIDKLKKAWPNCQILIVGMLIPPEMGKNRFIDFMSVYPRLAESNNCKLVPFLLKDVATIPELNQEDGKHPTADGQKIMAETIWETLKTMLY
jgi:acyl-CoA thioesterase-1